MTGSRWLAALLFIAIGWCLPRVAAAQNYSAYPNLNPGLSLPYLGANGANGNNPYMRLADPFSSQIPLYQTQVRPLIDNRNTLDLQGGQIQNLGRQARGVGYAGGAGTRRGFGGGGGTILSTGHPTRFMNYSHYYINSGNAGRR